MCKINDRATYSGRMDIVLRYVQFWSHKRVCACVTSAPCRNNCEEKYLDHVGCGVGRFGDDGEVACVHFCVCGACPNVFFPGVFAALAKKVMCFGGTCVCLVCHFLVQRLSVFCVRKSTEVLDNMLSYVLGDNQTLLFSNFGWHDI